MTGDDQAGDDREQGEDGPPTAVDHGATDDGPTLLARLPASEREAFAEPMGPVYDDVDVLFAALGADACPDDASLITVGDAVTAALVRADRPPDLAVVDGRTQRSPVDEATAAAVDAVEARVETVPNPAGTISAPLVAALGDALAAIRRGGGPRIVRVEGEEDLATVPAVLAARSGSVVLYGQPGEGIVLVAVDARTRDRCRRLAGRLDADPAFWQRLDVEPPDDGD
ncbi:MAG: GTP-dependent dephospho-CoA kinase family protein [Halobacteriaceae archaeon]